MSGSNSSLVNRQPPGPVFVLRNGSEYESAINHITVQTFSSSTFIFTCDQMGFIDFWHLETRRNCFHFSVQNHHKSMNSSKENGLIWLEVLSKTDIQGVLAVQSRNGVIHFFTVSDMRTNAPACDIRKLCSVETNFTAFCKCDSFLCDAGAHLAIPVDNVGESSFRVFFFGKSESLTSELVHQKTFTIIECNSSEGLPMCAGLVELLGQIKYVFIFIFTMIGVFREGRS